MDENSHLYISKDRQVNETIVIHAPNDISIVDVDIPTPKAGEALLKLLYGGICGSDLNIYKGNFAYGTYPRIPGHEFAAQIVSIGKNDRGLQEGMNVFANPYFNCGTCYACERKLFNCCLHNQTMGVQRDGAFSKYIVMPVDRLFDAHDLDPRLISLIEPFCIGYHGIHRAQVQPSDNVLIIGAGSIGILAALAAEKAGARVYICDISEWKIKYVEKHFTFAGSFQFKEVRQFLSEVEKITKENKFDVVVEAVGSPETFDAAVRATAYGGRVVLIGVSKKSLDFEFTMIQTKELNIYGSRNALDKDFIESYALISKHQEEFLPLITHTYQFPDANQAFFDLAHNNGTMLKTIIEF